MSHVRIIAIDDDRTPWSLRITLVLLLVAGLGWWFWDAAPAPVATDATGSDLAAAARVARTVDARQPTLQAAGSQDTAAASTTAHAASCPLQDLRIERVQAGEGLSQAQATRACVGATQLHHNGSVRSYEVQGVGPESWSLRVDTTQGSVLRAVLSSARGERFACEGEACAGLVLGTHDLRGARSLRLEQVAFVAQSARGRKATAALPELADTDASDDAAHGSEVDDAKTTTATAARRYESAGTPPAAQADAAAPNAIRVSALLRVPSEAQVPGLACTGPSVQVSAGDASRTTFCALGGAGFELADDGTRRYHFQNGDGTTLQLRVGPDERIARVDFGRFSCVGSACQGVQMQAADASDELGERSFFFGRTMLREAAAAGPGVVLDGSIVMPAQR